MPPQTVLAQAGIPLDSFNLLIPILIVLALLAFLLAALALWLGLRLGRQAGKLEAESERSGAEAIARGDAVKRSRAILTGQIGEQLAPFFPDFPCDPADARFIGKPIDYVAFPGLSKGTPEEVLFIEVKTGDSKLSSPERALKTAIQSGRVRWIEFRLPVITHGKP
jgi:predicted Holliday junction resolvase-like endonuclease